MGCNSGHAGTGYRNCNVLTLQVPMGRVRKQDKMYNIFSNWKGGWIAFKLANEKLLAELKELRRSIFSKSCPYLLQRQCVTWADLPGDGATMWHLQQQLDQIIIIPHVRGGRYFPDQHHLFLCLIPSLPAHPARCTL